MLIRKLAIATMVLGLMVSAGYATGAPQPEGQQGEASTQPMKFQKTVFTGHATVIQRIVSTHKDCTAEPVKIEISKQPEHGTLQVSEHDTYPPRSKGPSKLDCHKTKVTGTFINYTPADNFTGSDFLAYNILSKDENAKFNHPVEVTISVLQKSAKLLSAEKKLRAAVAICQEKRRKGELKTHVQSVTCSNAQIVLTFGEQGYPYMDLVHKYIDKRLEIARNEDSKKLTDEQAKQQVKDAANDLIFTERQRNNTKQ